MEKTSIWVGFNRRRHARINLSIPVVFQVVKPSLLTDKLRYYGPSLKSLTENVSLAGILMVSHAELVLGDILHIALDPPDQDPVEVQGRVVRVVKEPSTHRYFVGLEFLLANEKGLIRLLRNLVKDYDTIEDKMP